MCPRMSAALEHTLPPTGWDPQPRCSKPRCSWSYLDAATGVGEGAPVAALLGLRLTAYTPGCSLATLRNPWAHCESSNHGCADYPCCGLDSEYVFSATMSIELLSMGSAIFGWQSTPDAAALGPGTSLACQRSCCVLATVLRPWKAGEISCRSLFAFLASGTPLRAAGKLGDSSESLMSTPVLRMACPRARLDC